MSNLATGEGYMANTRSTPREKRRIAFQALYQLDARSETDVDAIRDAVLADQETSLSQDDLDEAFALALEAYKAREGADAALAELAPTWPAHRQPAVDRAILRLAWYEMTSGRTGPKIAVNEAVELAKQFSTERSPAFINGVLDKVLKKVLAERDEATVSDAATEEDEDATERDLRAAGLMEIKPPRSES